MGIGRDISLTVAQHGTYGSKTGGLQGDDAQVGQHGLGEDNAGDDQNGTGDDGT